MKSLVSVVMPAYNGEKYIGDAIESIINQSYTEWELIIIDDASMDHTIDVVYKYTDSRIKLYRNNENKGISYSTNLGIAKSKGRYIALLDDDDLAAKDRLALQVTYLDQNPSIDILGGRAVNINEKGDILGHDFKAPLNNPKFIKAWMLFSNQRFSNGTTMIRKEFIDRYNLKFKDDYYGIQDFKFMADSSKVGNISSIDRILQFKRIHDMEATQIYISHNYENRKESYARLQRESICDSGFELTSEQMKVVTELLPEDNSKQLSNKEMLQLIEVFDEICSQAKKMQVDYLDELKVVFKQIIIEKFMRRKDYFDLAKYVRDIL